VRAPDSVLPVCGLVRPPGGPKWLQPLRLTSAPLVPVCLLSPPGVAVDPCLPPVLLEELLAAPLFEAPLVREVSALPDLSLPRLFAPAVFPFSW
jgi:hypothetical protein